MTGETGDRAVDGLIGALVSLRSALAETRLPLELPEVAIAREDRSELIAQLDDYVLPRLRRLDAPLLAVIGGSTGAGKSTLVNSVVGARVSEPGVLRPTTRSPVLVHHPADTDWFVDDRILPELERITRASTDPGGLQLVATDALPQGIALLDAPDIDSVEERNRALATQLLAAADLWLFVTSAARYADQVPWDFLRRAAERSAAVAVVLDRVPDEATDVVSRDLARMLTERGLRESPLFVVRESRLGGDGLLPADEVRPIRGWLSSLSVDAAARSRLVRQTLSGAVASLCRRTDGLAGEVAGQVEMRDRLLREAHRAYDEATREIDEASVDGTLLRGEVLARWQEFVGTGELLKVLESKVSWLRDRLTTALRGKPLQASRVSVAVESGLQSLVVEHAEAAAERADASWRSVQAGRALLAGAEVDLSRASRDISVRAERMVRDWQQGVMDMVREEGADRRKTARFLSLGVNGLAVSLMMVVFASTGGVTGGEIGIAGGSALVGQRVLEAVFGDQAVRRLAARARADLVERVSTLMSEEEQRFSTLLAEHDVEEGQARRLRECAALVGRHRMEGAR